MTRCEWLLIGVIIVLCIVIAGCSSPVKADSEPSAHVMWINEVSDGRTITYQTFSEIQVPEHKITCFVFRAASQGAAMQCFKNSDIYNGGQ